MPFAIATARKSKAAVPGGFITDGEPVSTLWLE